MSTKLTSIEGNWWYVVWLLAVVYGGLVVYGTVADAPTVRTVAGVLFVVLLVILIGALFISGIDSRRSGVLVAVFTVATVLQAYLLVDPTAPYGASVPTILGMLGVLILVFGGD